MLDSDYLRRQAETCLSLSRGTFDLTIAGRLRAMAEDLQRKAVELDGARRGWRALQPLASSSGDTGRT